ncbi:MAG TPA: DUF72 domain-containing protein [Casimicrobiaceae bacterium]|nr:DUF72 domain-containing protein [Casimicrobiaceae bacterium]
MTKPIQIPISARASPGARSTPCAERGPSDAEPPTGAIRIGISGWRYPPWRGVFYPSGLAQRRELEYASHRFATIEINGSFYSLQRPEHYARWRDETPEGFVFSVKGPRFITHMLKLRDSDQALANFFASGIANLGEKLGPILWQLPPMLRFDAARLEPFLAALPRDTDEAAALARRRNEKVRGRARLAYGQCRPLRHALEVRHPTFVDAAFVDLLRRQQVALVVADTAGKWPYAEDLTADFVYARLHGDKKLYVSGYTDRALDRWCDRMVAWSKGAAPDDAQCISSLPAARCAGRDVFCYFDNDVKVKAPRDARALVAKTAVAGGNVIVPADDPDVPVARRAHAPPVTARRSWPSAGAR